MQKSANNIYEAQHDFDTLIDSVEHSIKKLNFDKDIYKSKILPKLSNLESTLYYLCEKFIEDYVTNDMEEEFKFENFEIYVEGKDLLSINDITIYLDTKDILKSIETYKISLEST